MSIGRAGPPDIDRIVNELVDAENGVVVLCSSTGTQFSLEHEDWRNGAFTEALLEALSGAADEDKDGYIHVSDIEVYVKRRVKELTNGAQTPRFGAHEGRFTNPKMFRVA